MKVKKITLQTPISLFALLLCFTATAGAADPAQKSTAAEKPALTSAPAAKSATVPPQEAQETIARINGRPIFAVELRRARKVVSAGQQIPAERQKEFDQQALEQIISAELLFMGAQKVEIKDLDKQVADKISMSRKRFPSEQEYEKALSEMEMNTKDLTEYTRRDLMISNFIQQTIVAKIKVSDDESRKFYDQNQDKFKQSESVRASHILIGVDSKATAAEKGKAREKAAKLRKELAGGADFAALAKENSTCPSSQQGGDLGYFGKGQMVPPFEKAAFSLNKGELSDVVETEFGYHIIKLMDKKDAESIAYKDAKPRIEEYLKGQKINAAVNSYLSEARKNAKIENLLK